MPAVVAKTMRLCILMTVVAVNAQWWPGWGGGAGGWNQHHGNFYHNYLAGAGRVGRVYGHPLGRGAQGPVPYAVLPDYLPPARPVGAAGRGGGDGPMTPAVYVPDAPASAPPASPVKTSTTSTTDYHTSPTCDFYTQCRGPTSLRCRAPYTSCAVAFIHGRCHTYCHRHTPPSLTRSSHAGFCAFSPPRCALESRQCEDASRWDDGKERVCVEVEGFEWASGNRFMCDKELCMKKEDVVRQVLEMAAVEREGRALEEGEGSSAVLVQQGEEDDDLIGFF